MYIYETVNFDTFARAFKQVRPDNFSTAGLSELYDHLWNMAEETGEPIELDVIALCCDWSEDTLYEVNRAYDLTDSETESEDTDDIYSKLSGYTTVLRVDADTVVYQVF